MGRSCSHFEWHWTRQKKSQNGPQLSPFLALLGIIIAVTLRFSSASLSWGFDKLGQYIFPVYLKILTGTLLHNIMCVDCAMCICWSRWNVKDLPWLQFMFAHAIRPGRNIFDLPVFDIKTLVVFFFFCVFAFILVITVWSALAWILCKCMKSGPRHNIFDLPVPAHGTRPALHHSLCNWQDNLATLQCNWQENRAIKCNTFSNTIYSILQCTARHRKYQL